MVKLLLDTHIFLWSLMEPSMLSQSLSKALDNPENELWLSPITIWEVMILSEKKHIQLDVPPIEWIKNVTNSLPFIEAPINFEVAMESRRIQFPHQDPADRFLAATAKVYDLTLATADKKIIENAVHFSIFPNK